MCFTTLQLKEREPIGFTARAQLVYLVYFAWLRGGKMSGEDDGSITAAAT